jgi:hypothetical protein
MIGRKATVGLSLLCALLFSTTAVQSAAATAGTNITGYTCAKVANKATGEFQDAHCDVKKATENGYEHKVLTGVTEAEATNETTGGATSTQVIEGSPFKVATKISCKTLVGEGTIENSEPSAGVHKLTGRGTLSLTNCTVEKPTPCTVKEPIVTTIGSVETQEALTGPKGEANAMGFEYKPEAGKPFTTITLEGPTCPLTAPFPVEGSVIATGGPGTAEPQTSKWSGATVVSTKEASMSKLTAATRPSTYEGIVTYRMKDATKAAITTTTVT